MIDAIRRFIHGDVKDVALTALDAPAGVVREDDLDQSSPWVFMNQQTALRTLTRRGILEHMPARSESNWQLRESWRVRDWRRLEEIVRGD